MADLDDFFAKKDRKKAKGGKKFTTTEEIAKKLEETGKKLEKPKPKEKPITQEGEEPQPVEEEDEWRDFEEEKKDYTGLKIGYLTVTETYETETEDERGEGEMNSDGEIVEGGTRHSGPWKRQEQPAQQIEPEQPAPVVTTQPSTGGSSYKAPHLRNAQASSASPRQRTRNTAPDINSEEYFPTLSAAQQQNNEPAGPWGRRRRDEGSFEEVRNRGGSRSYSVQETQTQAPKLSLGNKYGALSQDQS